MASEYEARLYFPFCRRTSFLRPPGPLYLIIPLHPQTQGKIERYHRSMKNVIKLNHYFCPSELEKAIDEWVKYYNERRFHESLDNLTPRDIYLGQGEKIKKIREIIKQNSINKRISENKRMILQHK
ncbi:integrase core domain-containing protein [Prevotella denticola]|uniref:integrase core domain-containing protein n=1 Tax=Prevotella denticola TaxID=28129 RepID=UPI0021D1418B|nr:integrase core domain-containing protein [Prevotella denticola]